jgi:nucleotidyltransferase substrate binding protein (TIGR01987 family)
MGQYRERFELARQQYNKALDRLHEVVDLDETDIIRDSLIQRFEFTYELSWKCMFYWMKDQGEQVPEMQKPIIQNAFRCQMISDPKLWEDIKDCRDETSHTYNESKAVEVVAFVRGTALAAFDVFRQRIDSL